MHGTFVSKPQLDVPHGSRRSRPVEAEGRCLHSLTPFSASGRRWRREKKGGAPVPCIARAGRLDHVIGPSPISCFSTGLESDRPARAQRGGGAAAPPA